MIYFKCEDIDDVTFADEFDMFQCWMSQKLSILSRNTFGSSSTIFGKWSEIFGKTSKYPLTREISSWTLEEKCHISAHPCIIHYLYLWCTGVCVQTILLFQITFLFFSCSCSYKYIYFFDQQSSSDWFYYPVTILLCSILTTGHYFHLTPNKPSRHCNQFTS